MKNYILPLVLFFGLFYGSIYAQTARLQVIHNSADIAAQEVDVYVNGDLLIDNFAFRTSSPFIDVPAGVNLEVAIAPSTSSSVMDAIASFDYNLASGETYIIVANGIVSASGYDPAIPFDLHVYGMGREAASMSGNTDVLVFHGSTDAPIVDVYESSVPAGTIVDDFAYGNFAGYLELPTADYVLEIRDETGMDTYLSYDAPLSSLGLDDAALVVLASGFLDPSVNSDGAGFGLYVALPSGGELIPLPVSMARLQVIHNSADIAAQEVDVYVNGDLLIDNFAFRTSSPFIDVPAGVNLEVAIAPSTSSSVMDAIASFDYNLASGETYIIVANGIVSASGYDPAIPFDLHVYGMGREAASMSGNTDVLVFHGSTDAPVVDVYESSVPAGTIVDDFAYGNFAGYLELPTADYVLEIRDETGMDTYLSYDAPLSSLGLDDAALVVLASGFLDPSVNSDGAGFGLYVALPSGGELIPLPVSMARLQVIHNSADIAAQEVDVYVNGDLLIDNFAFRTSSPFIDVPAGVNLEVAIAPSTSSSVMDAIASFDYNLASGETYIIVANGIVSASGYDPAIPFDLHVYGMGREAASMSGNTDVLVFHGSTDAPIVDVYESSVPAGTIVDDFAYGNFAGYLELPTADYVLEIRDETGDQILFTYQAPLSTLGLENQALVVLASGFVNPAENSNGAPFSLFVALTSGGNLVELPVITNVEESLIANISTAYPNPAMDKINFTLEGAESAAKVSVFSTTGQLIDIQDVEVSGNSLTYYTNNLNSGQYIIVVESGRSINRELISIIK
jgi:K+-transporting ATPase c subunit